MRVRGTMVFVALGNMVLAIAAFGREALLASAFGADARADAWLVSFGFTDALANMVLGSAFFAVSVPLMVGSQPGALHDIRNALLRKALTYGSITGLALVASAPFLARVLAPGLGPDGWRSCTVLFRCIGILPVAYCLQGVLGAAMNARGAFWATSLSPILFNAVMVSMLLVAGNKMGTTAMALGALVGAAVMLLPMVPGHTTKSGKATGTGCAETAPGCLPDPLVPTIAFLALNQAIPLMERFFASMLDGGSIASLNFAYKVSQAPYWIAGIAVTQVLFPRLSGAVGNQTAFRRELNTGLTLIMAIVLPVSACLFVWAPQIVALLFGRGAFNAGDALHTTQALRGYCLGAWAQASLGLLTRGIQAGREWKPLVASALAGLATATAIDAILPEIIGVGGIAVGTSGGMMVSALFMHVYLLRKEAPAVAAFSQR